MINSKTKLICVIGNPISHSLSPLIHNKAFYDNDINAVYLAFEPNNIKSFIDMFKDLKFWGANITTPYKEVIIDYLDEVSDISKICNSVNTIFWKDGKLCGTTTDGSGLLNVLPNNCYNIGIFGCGASARSIIYELVNEGKRKISIFLRNVNKYNDFLDKLNIKKSIYDVNSDIDSIIKYQDIVINATSIGMNGNENNKFYNINFNCNTIVYDLVYSNEVTDFIKKANSCGCKVYDGRILLVSQALESFNIWTGKKFDLIKMYEYISKGF